MSKYRPLSEHLAASPGEEWLASFPDVEAVLGFSLPKAARNGRAWWANDPAKAHSRAWIGHGWEVGDVDPAAERVIFRRAAAAAPALANAADLEPPGADEPAAALTPAQPPAPKAASEAVAHDGLLLPAALLSAGVMVAATMGAFLLRTLMLRRR